MEKRHVPALRFKGFTDDWEQRKLGEVTAIFHSGEGIKSDEIKESGQYPVYGGNGLRGYTDRYTYDGEFALIGRQGALCGNMNYSIGKAYFTEHAVIVKANPSNSTHFMYYLLEIMNLGQYSDQSAQPGLAVNKLCKLNGEMPSKGEQEQIAKCFGEIDHLITLHQRKHKKLLALKKALLEKMFPKNEEKIPEVRFFGFTGDWEQRKFITLAMKLSHMGFSSLSLPSVEYEDVSPEIGILNKNIYKKKVSKKGVIFDENQVLYGKLRPYLHNWLNPNFSGVAVGDWWVLQPLLVSKGFLYRLIQTRYFHNVANQSSGSKMPRADWNLVSNSVMLTPASFKEQKQIAKCFDNIDSLITLHQRKLEKLQNIKKAMLEKMFA